MSEASRRMSSVSSTSSGAATLARSLLRRSSWAVTLAWSSLPVIVARPDQIRRPQEAHSPVAIAKASVSATSVYHSARASALAFLLNLFSLASWSAVSRQSSSTTWFSSRAMAPSMAARSKRATRASIFRRARRFAVQSPKWVRRPSLSPVRPAIVATSTSCSECRSKETLHASRKLSTRSRALDSWSSASFRFLITSSNWSPTSLTLFRASFTISSGLPSRSQSAVRLPRSSSRSRRIRRRRSCVAMVIGLITPPCRHQAVARRSSYSMPSWSIKKLCTLLDPVTTMPREPSSSRAPPGQRLTRSLFPMTSTVHVTQGRPACFGRLSSWCGESVYVASRILLSPARRLKIVQARDSTIALLPTPFLPRMRITRHLLKSMSTSL